MDGWDALRVLVGVGRGVMVRTFLRGFFTVGVGVGETAVARAAAGVRVGVAVAEGVGVGVTGSGSALAVVAAEQPAVKASATAAAMSRERIIVPFGSVVTGGGPHGETQQGHCWLAGCCYPLMRLPGYRARTRSPTSPGTSSVSSRYSSSAARSRT